MILAGVDEAGYGPILGPLCTGLAVVRVEGTDDARRAEAAARDALADPVHGVRIGDSKAIHRPAAGIGALEREVLAVLAALRGRVPPDGRALLEDLGAGPPPGDHPWYGNLREVPLPRAADGAEARERGRALAAALGDRGVHLLAVRARALPEGRFNESVARLGNKAAVLFEGTADRIAEALDEAGPGEPVEVLCDRQGARRRYGPLLQGRFPGRLVGTAGEGPGASAYDLGGRGPRIRVRFEERADAASPLAGLASMAAKYLRELWMERLNAWVLREAPGVRPTAGYWTDGVRFLGETGPARARLGVDDGTFVRSR